MLHIEQIQIMSIGKIHFFSFLDKFNEESTLFSQIWSKANRMQTGKKLISCVYLMCWTSNTPIHILLMKFQTLEIWPI